MKKKVVSVLLGMVMMCSVVTACGSNPVSEPSIGSSENQKTEAVVEKETADEEVTVASFNTKGVSQDFPFTLEEAPERDPEKRMEKSVAVSTAYHESKSGGDLAHIKFFYPDYAGSEGDAKAVNIVYPYSDSEYTMKSCDFGTSVNQEGVCMFKAKYLPETGELYAGSNESGVWEGCFIGDADQIPTVYCEKVTVKDKDITGHFDITYTRFRVDYGDGKNEIFMINGGLHNSQSLFSLGKGSLDEVLQLNPTYDVDSEVLCEFADV